MTGLDQHLKYVDAVQNAWKGWTLAVRPAYHMRNLAGNLWNAYTIAGVKNPKAFTEAMSMQAAALYSNNPEMAKQLGDPDYAVTEEELNEQIKKSEN